MAVNFPEHITLAEAWKILETRFAKDADKFKTKMEITAALDHVLAEDILAGRNVPHYAASAVDGYALQPIRRARPPRRPRRSGRGSGSG